MSKLRTAIDHKSLELELQEALRADELYRLQNDAKLRAVEQNVPTYEDFRQMVLAAHLKPLQHADLRPKIKAWNSVVNTDNANAIPVLDKLKENQSKDCLKSLNNSDNTFEGKIPTTYEEFLTVWKPMKTYRKKFDYLKNIRHILHKKIFRAEIPATLLVEIINVCLQNISITDNIAAIVDILNILSKCNRFSLAVNFMGQDEREMCTRLFHHMLSSVEHKNEILEDKIKTLGLIYEVTFK